MTHLADRMNRFLIASRDVFNSHFREEASSGGVNEALNLQDDCLLVEQALFKVIVGGPSEEEAPPYGQTQDWIRVLPFGTPPLPIMLNRELSSGYWDYPLERFDATDDLRFVRYFDWSAIERRDHRYVMVLVVGSPSHPEIVGKLGLIESHHVTYEAVPPEDEPTYPQRFKISFRVTHPTWDAERIIETLQLAPSRAWTVSEPRSTPKDTPLEGLWRNTYCCFPMPVDDGDDLVPWLIGALDTLEPHGDFIRKLTETGGTAEFFIGLFVQVSGGCVLPPEVLRRMTALNIALSLDIYGGPD